MFTICDQIYNANNDNNDCKRPCCVLNDGDDAFDDDDEGDNDDDGEGAYDDDDEDDNDDDEDGSCKRASHGPLCGFPASTLRLTVDPLNCIFSLCYIVLH